MMLETTIKNILDEIVTPIIGKRKVFPVFGTGKLPFVTYTITPMSGGAVKESQVEVKSIADSIDRAIEIRDSINEVLDMTEQVPSINSRGVTLRSQLAGGGQLFNDSIQVWELSCIYIITWR